MKFKAFGKLLPTALLSTMILGVQVQAQSYFKTRQVLLNITKGSSSISKNITMYEYEKDRVLVQKVDRVVTVCLPPEQTDGWVDNSGKDYFQMPKAEKAQFLKDNVLGINKTADLVVEKCLKSKPRTYESFKTEMQSCSQKDAKLASLYNNVIVQNGEENRKALYPTLTAGNQCYSRPIYRWDLEERETQTGRSVELNAKVQLSKPADLLSFETEQVIINVNHNMRDGFFLTLSSSTHNKYDVVSRNSSSGYLTLEISPSGRNQISLSESIAPAVYCNASEKQIQLDGGDKNRLSEIMNASSGSKIGVSYTEVTGWFNKPVSNSWPYAEFNADDLMKGIFSRPISNKISVKSGTKVKYNVSIVGSRHYKGKVDKVVKCF